MLKVESRPLGSARNDRPFRGEKSCESSDSKSEPRAKSLRAKSEGLEAENFL